MIKPNARLPLSRQCELLSVSRSSLYYRPRPEDEQTLVLLRRLDELFTEHPMYGSRCMQAMLAREGVRVGRRRIRRLMRTLGLWPVTPKPDTSRAHPEHQIYPYLLRGLAIERADQVWASDITYIPMQRGFLYLVAILDWATRKVLAWRLSNTLTSDFCVGALEEALARHGRPEIFNTDQGSQFTSAAFTDVLKAHDIRISMDGRGRCHDNIFVERLWWTVKHEWVYLRPAANGIEQQRSLAAFFDWYNQRPPHQSLNWRTPDEAYFAARAANQPLAA
jgi:putative transposase